MTHTQGNTGRMLALVAAVGGLAACSSTAPGLAQSGSPSQSAAVHAPSAPVAAVVPTTAAATPTCGTPPPALVDRASMSIAAHPGAITATTYVFAATTDTGDWYVLGLDREYVHDDGSPVGERSRSLALTNSARTTDGSVAMIPLSVAVSERLPISWDAVSWTGDTLAAGKRAVDRAISCLDGRSRG